MKKILSIVLLLIAVLIIIVFIGINERIVRLNEASAHNLQFEKYNGQTLYGADILTIINKAIDNNEKNEIPKDEKGFYIENNLNSIKVELTLLSTDENEKIVEIVHQMESLEKAGLNKFITNFGLVSFECTKIEYNSQNKVSKIYIKQIEL